MPESKEGVMPKETVQYPRTDSNSGTEVTVHWGRESWVQLNVQRHVWKRVETEHTGELVSDDSAADAVELITDPLDRDEINALIRALRRARDQAYGPDA